MQVKQRRDAGLCPGHVEKACFLVNLTTNHDVAMVGGAVKLMVEVAARMPVASGELYFLFRNATIRSLRVPKHLVDTVDSTIR